MRTQIMDAIKAAVPELTVDWYDGLFDEKDVADWAIQSPACFVAIKRVPTANLPTMELHCDMNCLATIIVQDEDAPRDADERLWDIMERIVTLVNLNAFGNPNSAPANHLTFERLLEPELRRQGIALGVVDWMQTLTIGRNRVLERDFYYNPTTGSMITQTPRELTGSATIYDVDGQTSHETQPLMDR